MDEQNEHKVDAENFRAWNDEMLRRYDPEQYHLHAMWLIRQIEKRRVNKIAQAFQTRLHARVLEVGVGTGNIRKFPR